MIHECNRKSTCLGCPGVVKYLRFLRCIFFHKKYWEKRQLYPGTAYYYNFCTKCGE